MAFERDRLLWKEAEMEDAPDGAFVRLNTQIQIIDPDSLRDFVRKLPGAMRSFAAASGAPGTPIRADRRAGRRPVNETSTVSNAQAEGIANVLEVFTPGTVRLRLVRKRFRNCHCRCGA